MNATVPHVSLTAAKQEAYYPIIIEGNKVLLSLFRKYGTIVRKKLQKRKITRNDFRVYIFKILKEKGTVRIGGDCISKTDLAKIQAVNDLEWEIVCSFGKAYNKIAKYWSCVEHNTSLRFDDFYQEAICGLVNALYCYMGQRGKIKIKFTTYAWWAMNNRIRREINKNSPLSHLTQRALELHQRFIRQQKSYGEYVTNDRVCQDLQLNKTEIQLLQKILVRVQDLSSVSNGNKNEDTSDYTAFARNIEEKVTLDFDQKEAVMKAPLTPFEAQVFYAYLEGGKGWQTKVADNSLNPKTGKPFTKQAVKLAYNSAVRKIRETYFGKSYKEAA